MVSPRSHGATHGESGLALTGKRSASAVRSVWAIRETGSHSRSSLDVTLVPRASFHLGVMRTSRIGGTFFFFHGSSVDF